MTAGGPPILPPYAAGLRIGLMGGSFDPPHKGHRLASLLAMRRLGLDRIWWLVSPGNPLKDTRHLAPLAERMEAARQLADHPRIAVTAIESQIGTRYTYNTLSYLTRRCGEVHFVWLMGADNLKSFHRWKRWREIVGMVPIAAIDRPGSTLNAPHSVTAGVLAPYRLDESDGMLLATAKPPAFVFLHGPRSDLSSTQLRLNRQENGSKENGSGDTS